jgi:hypothetical protein
VEHLGSFVCCVLLHRIVRIAVAHDLEDPLAHLQPLREQQPLPRSFFSAVLPFSYAVPWVVRVAFFVAAARSPRIQID